MLQNRYAKWILWCVIVMMALTILSRAADSVLVARVNAEPFKSGILVWQTKLEGQIDVSGKRFVRSQTGLRVDEILRGAGSVVAEGDVLIQLDYEDVLEKTGQVEIELSNLNLEIQKLRLDSAGGSNISAIESAEEELARALADDAFNRQINDGVQMQADKRRIEDAQKKLDETRRAYNESTQRSDIDIAIKENSRKLKQQEYDELRMYAENGGKIIAPVGGTVGELFAVQGQTITGENFCSIIPEDAGYMFSGELNADDAEYLRTGDSITITLAGKSTPVRGKLYIKSVSGGGEKTSVLVDLPTGSGAYYGQKATAVHEEKSEEYQSIVPLSAICGNENDYYVLIPRESGGILGTEIIAARVDVTVLETDNKNAAIQSTLGSSDKIIYKSSKTIAEGDRIRVQSSQI